MKKLIFFLVLLVFGFNVHAQQKPKPRPIVKKIVKKDSVKLFYGLTAQKILSLSVAEGKLLIKKKKITVSDYFIARLDAKNYLLEEEIKKDSIETMRIYDRIERKLGMKKKNE